MPLKEDFTGRQIGKLKILKRADIKSANNKVLWECQCECCGKICFKNRDYLIKKSHLPKACSLRCAAALPINTKIEYLTIIDYIFNDGETTKYKCQCDCGNVIIVKADHLKNGTTKSCGCLRKEKMKKLGEENSQIRDLTNQRFGKLIALEPTELRKHGSVVWKCKCDCGKIHFASSNALTQNQVSSCPECNIISAGEERIKYLLKNNNINFETQKTFEDCINPTTKCKLRFDFYIENNYLIEYDGETHYSSDYRGWYNEEQLKIQQERDNLKNQWCIDNNVPLIRIPYTHLNNLCLEDLLLKTSKYIKYNK